jgi:hypothetical protein
MKRQPVSRTALATHEAGHVILIALTKGLELGDFTWHRLPDYEIAHAEVRVSSDLDWDREAVRHTIIARRAAVALAGGASEATASNNRADDAPRVRAVYDRVGRVDFELAHEWLTLQRYDPDQAALESEIVRLHDLVLRLLDTETNRSAVSIVRRRILDRLDQADAAGVATLVFPGAALIDRLAMARGTVDFTLEATLMDRGRRP